MQRKYAEQRKAAGICLKCGRPVGREGRVTCAACGKYSAAEHRLRRERLTAEGLCVVCGKVAVADGYKTCPVCREYNRTAKERSRLKKEAG